MRKASVLPFERILTLEESNLLKGAVLKAVEVFERWGYNYLKLPAFEFYESQRSALGERAKESITFRDPDTGELVSLRTDFTVQVVKSVSFLRMKHFPLRIYYFGTLYYTGGRSESFQTGIELIGVPETEGDAEVVTALHDYLRSLGFRDLIVSIGHVGIVRRILSEVEERFREEVALAFREKNVTLLRSHFGDESVSELPLVQGGEEVLETLSLLGFEEEREELEALGNLLSQAGVAFVYDLSEVREFPYYTGAVFEFFCPQIGSPIAGGGRYDRLSEVYGERFPATGGTVYLDLLMSAMDPRREEKDLFILDLSEDKRYGFRIASLLRSRGYRVGRDIVRRGVQHSIVYAFAEGYRKVVLIRDERDVRLYTSAKEYTTMSLKEFLELF